MLYKSLKEGWIPYSQAFQKYIKRGDEKRFINRVPNRYKEKISRIWFVDITWFKAYSEGRVEVEYIIKEEE
ncbi:hypothetical protein FDJ70_07810 [Clostridium botulinum]|uniref:hypothetical protein n=1 Tax=Clostridium botulinum TaxID=1491 RepID=UPI0013F7FF81|nr:hypothetical protein [Clostridium botulinum]MCD3217432.1 hypothetical protein [Clostridium botulinum C]NFV47578.1 hypothetical protein [Clostridium botulinum]